ncbi:alpha/beta hydrolase [Rheinheimera maricola]|uniref:Esterase family protein n=1 Tax=Rheinheimera maricola TaxID=2793282 RepID=A0ABS7X8A4_9GAMM|nr:alpha/beta hydrolase-fold protein [Rheinheimera maricola]MBZ9611037.1 hypothetical protein [Rheinheimera maricola]
MKYSYLVLLIWCQTIMATPTDYSLSDNLVIYSEKLGYSLQYRVLAPLNSADIQAAQIMFVTDGQNYLQDAKFDQLLVSLMQQNNIAPVIAVFVDSRDPDDLTINRRHSQFMCNADYAGFFQQELIPVIEQRFRLQFSERKSMIMGLSFGALNAGCFGVLLPKSFTHLAMQSPASDKHVKILAKVYQQATVSAVKMFITVGTRNDNTRAGRAFHRQVVKQGYDVSYVEVPYGHVWDNWRSTLEQIMRWFAPYATTTKAVENANETY